VYEQGVFEADTYDAIGTGDAFVAGYLAKRIDGGGVADSLEWAAAAAALKRTVDGDLAVITPGDVESVVDGAGWGSIGNTRYKQRCGGIAGGFAVDNWDVGRVRRRPVDRRTCKLRKTVQQRGR